jgi:hypothetical protein
MRSLPVGAIGPIGSVGIFRHGWGTASADSPAAAILLPLYYLVDSTITLVRRFLNHEKVGEAHRSPFYQRATDHGFTVFGVVGRVFIVNLILAALALVTIVMPSLITDLAALFAGSALVVWLLVSFARGKK